jgi:two-component system, LytTR family, response regulator
MTRAIIIDDERNAVDVLAMQIEKYCPTISVVSKCSGGEEGVAAIEAHEPQLVFLDIEMPHVSGFDVLERTKHHNYKVIFTTAYDQFAVRAFKYSAIDYLLKPIDIEELKSAVSRLRPMSDHSLEHKLEQLYEALDIKVNRVDKLAMPMGGGGFEMVPYTDIIRCESDSNYTTCFLADGRKTTFSKTLGDIEKQLPSSFFYRIHNSHLINLHHIKRMFKSDGGYVIMNDGSQVGISRSKKEEFWDIVGRM